MPKDDQIAEAITKIKERYSSYLRNLFYFRDADLRQSFQKALTEAQDLTQGPFSEPAREFEQGVSPKELLQDIFGENHGGLLPALTPETLYLHQELAIRAGAQQKANYVVATGTASGKTESFLYSILCYLYSQHLEGRLKEPGVRAMILYPMNALANDQRKRIGELCASLLKENFDFQPTIGQFIGQTPWNAGDKSRHAVEPVVRTEMIYRDDMLRNPPHILLTNYSMLEYLLIRPDASSLFDGERGKHWQYIVLDEAHQYRGTRGMEMGMLVRRLKNRIRDGGKENPDFTCVATSATMSTDKGREADEAIAQFAGELFGETFLPKNVFVDQNDPPQEQPDSDTQNDKANRLHFFVRALEGAFLLHEGGADKVVLNRTGGENVDAGPPQPVSLEVALCRECGQHYYVGRELNGKLVEAVRDASSHEFAVQYYLPNDDVDVEGGTRFHLCRICGQLSQDSLSCGCAAPIKVWLCPPDKDNEDELGRCPVCHYGRGSMGDPVQEIVHGADGPNAVIATVLHEELESKKVLAFADSRQDAAFFAWYAQDTYLEILERNLLYRAIKERRRGGNVLSIDDIENRLLDVLEGENIFSRTDTLESKQRHASAIVLSEAVTRKRRLSLEGVGLVSWSVQLPDEFNPLDIFGADPWNLDEQKARQLVSTLLDNMRIQQAITTPATAPAWDKISPYAQRSFTPESPAKRKTVRQWGSKQSALVRHYLSRILQHNGVPPDQQVAQAHEAMTALWRQLRRTDEASGGGERDSVFVLAGRGVYRLNHRRLRLRLTEWSDLFRCSACGTPTAVNVRGVCTRNQCKGELRPVEGASELDGHYRQLYLLDSLPSTYVAEEHTAQIESALAFQRQKAFENGEINLLSSSTTFEVGVDLGELQVAFLRNVPPEPFNYAQRVGRAGRRSDSAGLAVTYCRRNPHDLYHFEKPVERIINGVVRPPRFEVKNRKIILRHMVAMALSAFFRTPHFEERFGTTEAFLGSLESPTAAASLRGFCTNNTALENAIRDVVPSRVHAGVGLEDSTWIDSCFGEDSYLARAELEMSHEYTTLRKAWKDLHDLEVDRDLTPVERGLKARLNGRIRTIRDEQSLPFLSRKAIIPKYGFPVDVVELNIWPKLRDSNKVILQRDLAQAIAEYGPGTKVVANKLEWESYGLKQIPAKELPIKYYRCNKDKSFEQWEFDGSTPTERRYIQPIFGFVAPMKEPLPPKRRSERLYTTRPFFHSFEGEQPTESEVLGLHITEVCPGKLVVLCEGRVGAGFYLCLKCGSHFTHPTAPHKSHSGEDCDGTLQRFSYGHEIVTDVVRMQFPSVFNEWKAYSVGYAVMLGVAEVLNVPQADLNVTLAKGSGEGQIAIVLYDNVPGGAELVAQLSDYQTLVSVLDKASVRVGGDCGCGTSCYGCLRSYRNQFAHPYLQRKVALEHLQRSLARARD